MHFRTKLTLLGVLVTAALAAVVVSVAQGAGPTTPGSGRGPEIYTIGLFGDMPYNALGKSQCRYCLPMSTTRTSRSRSSMVT